MNTWVRREALKAAAKVAVSLSTVSAGLACGAVVEPSQDPANDQSASTAEPRKPAAAVSTNDTPAAKPPTKNQPAAVDAGPTLVDATVDDVSTGPIDAVACEARMDAVSPDGGNEFMEKLPDTADIRACCVSLLTDYAKNMEAWDGSAETWPEFNHRWGCCHLVGQDPDAGWSVSACTPWGPPMPPAMLA